MPCNIRYIAPRFPLGRILATPGAIAEMEESATTHSEFLNRHAQGDWGDLDDHDTKENDFAIDKQLRLLSSYTLPSGKKLWVITEADRSATTLLLPEEY
jgi:hypothetical protein